ncbi:hypothetical protein [Pseudomonas sp. QTF5]|uniref:hypothetical protein n=1 Tax=Pseudomonas sp. QTF5 TaxID=1435425 RepID=UPI002115BAC8|nr:hypothetical protein [Pseudomonas sp. QTF5]
MTVSVHAGVVEGERRLPSKLLKRGSFGQHLARQLSRGGQKVGSEISAIVEYHDMAFAQGWTVQITSPGSDNEVVAICPL